MTKRFTKPTPAEVTAYGKSRGFPIDGEEFCDFYESKGWMIGKSPMKDWQAAVRTWERSWKKRQAGSPFPERETEPDLDTMAEEFTHETDDSDIAGLFSDFALRDPEK